MPANWELSFLSLSQKLCVAEEAEANEPIRTPPDLLLQGVSFLLMPFCDSSKFLAVAANLFSITATGPDKVVFPMLKHSLVQAWIFFRFLILSGLCIAFFSSEILLFFARLKNLSTQLFLSSLYSSLTLPQSCLSASFYPVYSFFWSVTPFSFPARQVSALVDLFLIKFFYFSQPILDGFIKPKQGSRTTINFSKTFSFVWHSVLIYKLISVGLPPCCSMFDKIQLLLAGRHACVSFQN